VWFVLIRSVAPLFAHWMKIKFRCVWNKAYLKFSKNHTNHSIQIGLGPNVSDQTLLGHPVVCYWSSHVTRLVPQNKTVSVAKLGLLRYRFVRFTVSRSVPCQDAGQMGHKIGTGHRVTWGQGHTTL